MIPIGFTLVADPSRRAKRPVASSLMAYLSTTEGFLVTDWKLFLVFLSLLLLLKPIRNPLVIPRFIKAANLVSGCRSRKGAQFSSGRNPDTEDS